MEYGLGLRASKVARQDFGDVWLNTRKECPTIMNKCSSL